MRDWVSYLLWLLVGSAIIFGVGLFQLDVL